MILNDFYDVGTHFVDRGMRLNTKYRIYCSMKIPFDIAASDINKYKTFQLIFSTDFEILNLCCI